MVKLHIQAQHLQPGDIVGSGEMVSSVASGTKIPKGKVEIYLDNLDRQTFRMSYWGKYTMINIERERYAGGLTDKDLEVDGYGP